MSRPANVLHLIPGLEIGGLEMVVVNLLEGLDRDRFRPTVCCYDGLGALASRLAVQGVGIHLAKRTPGVDLRYVFRLAGVLRKARVDILHLHNPTAFFYGTLAGKAAGTPCIIYTEHGRDFSSSRKVRLANRLLAKMVDRIVTVAEFGKRYLVAQEGISEKKITTIHNGIDPQRFGATHDRDAIRAALGLQADDTAIGIVARLDPIKNHAGLLMAMQQVVAAMPHATLLIIGDGPLRGQLESLTGDLALEGHVRFLGTRGDVPQLLSALDLFVLNSHSEGLSLTLIEASAAARPIVATNVGGNPEVVEPGANGLLVPPDQPDALAKAMLQILADPAMTRRMGSMGLMRLERQFTLRGMVRQYEALYSSCLPS